MGTCDGACAASTCGPRPLAALGIMLLSAYISTMPTFTLQDKCINPGADWTPQVDAQNKATLVILLTSS